MKCARGHNYQSCELALKQLNSDRFPLDLITTHRFGLDKTHDAIKAVGGSGEVIHVSLMPWEPALDCRLPVTVVTGALGAGKTTLVNHLIRTGDRRLAVIVNEFGDIGIDGDLIESGTEDLIELSFSSGCICCVVRGAI